MDKLVYLKFLRYLFGVLPNISPTTGKLFFWIDILHSLLILVKILTISETLHEIPFTLIIFAPKSFFLISFKIISVTSSTYTNPALPEKGIL